MKSIVGVIRLLRSRNISFLLVTFDKESTIFFWVMIHLLWQLLQFLIVPTTIFGLSPYTELSLIEQFLRLLILLILRLQLFNPLWKATWKACKFCTNFFYDSSPSIIVVNSWKFKGGYPSNNSKSITRGYNFNKSRVCAYYGKKWSPHWNML